MNFFWELLKTSIRASVVVRGAFLLQMGLMIGSNLVYLAIWALFFREFREVKGWQFDDMMVMMAIVIGAMGISKIVFGGVKQITKTIVTGNLDPFMTQPKNCLLQLLLSRSQPKGWGQMFTGFALMGLSAPLWSYPLVLFAMVCSCLIFVAVGVIAHAIAFWFGPMEEISNKYTDSLFLFLHYPTNIYSGALKFVMFTALPVGVIGYLPVQLIRQFSWVNLAIFIGSTLVFVGLAFFVFYRGIKRYESGNQFGIRF